MDLHADFLDFVMSFYINLNLDLYISIVDLILSYILIYNFFAVLFTKNVKDSKFIFHAG